MEGLFSQDSSQEDVVLIMDRVRHSYSSSKPPLVL